MAKRIEVVAYSNEGQRLLMEHTMGPNDIAKAIDVHAGRVTEWRSGQTRPNDATRRLLNSACGIPVASWDCAPTRTVETAPAPGPKGARTVSKTETVAGPDRSGPREPTDEDLEAYGLAGLEALVDRLRETFPNLPAKDKVSAMNAEGRLHQTIASMRAKRFDARREYLDGSEFAHDVQILAAAWPGDAAALRAAVGRLGVTIPAPPTVAQMVNRKAPTDRAGILFLIHALRTAAEWKRKGEPYLAAAKVSELCLDVHAEQIAAVLAGETALAGEFLQLLGTADHQIISKALERQLALASVKGLKDGARKMVAELLEAYGLGVVAKQLGGTNG